MEILLTGASGFIGKNVLKRLKGSYNGKEVNNIVIMSGNMIKNGGDAFKDGNTSIISSKGYQFDSQYLYNECPIIDVIVHIGAFVPKSAEEANDIGNSTSNVRNTECLLKAASNLPNLKKFIYISTVDVYSATDSCLTEKSVTVPQTMYGWSKLYCERMVETCCKNKNITYNILRLGHIYGEGEEKYKKVMPEMIKAALSGKNISVYGDGEALRTYLYIKDAAAAIVSAVNLHGSGVINVVGNETISVNKLAEMVIKISESDVRINHIKSDVPNRNLCFDNGMFMTTLLSSLTPLYDGLTREIKYMRRLMEK